MGLQSGMGVRNAETKKKPKDGEAHGANTGGKATEDAGADDSEANAGGEATEDARG